MAPVDQPRGILIGHGGRNLHLQYNNLYLYTRNFKETEFVNGGYVKDSYLGKDWFLLGPFGLVKWSEE